MRRLQILPIVAVMGVLAVGSAAVAHTEPVDTAAEGVTIDDEGDEHVEMRPEDLVLSEKDIEGFAVNRARLGLDGSLATVRVLAADPAAPARGAQIGFPLSEEELAVLASRLDVQQGSESVVAAARQLAPDSFGGAWLDLALGTINVAFTDADASRLEALRAVSRYPDAVRVHQVRFTQSALSDVTSRVFESREELTARGVTVRGSSQDDRRNGVVVLVESPSENASQAISNALGVDQAMIIVEAFIEEEQEFGPPLGGHGLSMACSTGAHGYVNGIFGVAPYLITAAHCGDSGKHHNGGGFGGGLHDPLFTTNSEVNGGSVDAQKMNMGNPPWTVTTLVEGWAAGTFRLVGVAAAGGAYDIQGGMVCQVGATTKGVNNCAPLDSTNYSCGSYSGMRAVNPPFAAPGDSGGTVYGSILFSTDVPLAGFIQGSCNGKHRYTFQENARSALGLHGWYVN